MGKEVLKDALRCLTGERDCNICYYNDLAEERDTCCINVISEEALEYIEELERKLKDYQDKIENGTLIELPCKMGTTLFFIYNKPYADKPNLTPKIHETNGWYFDVCQKGVAISTRIPYGYNSEYFYYLGDMVFLTKAEAESKIKEIENER